MGRSGIDYLLDDFAINEIVSLQLDVADARGRVPLHISTTTSPEFVPIFVTSHGSSSARLWAGEPGTRRRGPRAWSRGR